MAKDKDSKSKPSVKVGDMKAKQDPKGGGIKGEMAYKVIAPIDHKVQPTGLVDTNALKIKLHK